MLGVVVGLQPLELTDKDIVEMVMFPVVNEACRVLAEKIVVQASDLDIASVFGMGFPPYRCEEPSHLFLSSTFLSKVIIGTCLDNLLPGKLRCHGQGWHRLLGRYNWG